MKVIDKTPFQNEKGTLGPWQRFQGMLEYGSSWNAEVEAQKSVIAQLDRVLEKGFTLIRNLNLENSKIIEPLILVGPSGVYVLYVTPITGFFEAKGDEWNVIRNEQRTPAPLNLLSRVARLARAVQVYLNRQGVYLPGLVEPVLIASSPGVHIESLRPIVRVVLSDAVKQWAASLLQSRAVLRPEAAHEVVDHLLNPHKKPPSLQPQGAAFPAVDEEEPGPAGASPSTTQGAVPQRARAIFRAAEEAKPFDPADLSFEFDEHGTAEMPDAAGAERAAPRAAPEPRMGAFTARQWTILVVMLIVEFLVLAGYVYVLLFASS